MLVENTDYTMTLEVDFDPGPGTDFAVLPAPYYDVDTNPLNSWDDTDGHHDNPGIGAVRRRRQSYRSA